MITDVISASAAPLTITVSKYRIILPWFIIAENDNTVEFVSYRMEVESHGFYVSNWQI